MFVHVWYGNVSRLIPHFQGFIDNHQEMFTSFLGIVYNGVGFMLDGNWNWILIVNDFTSHSE